MTGDLIGVTEGVRDIILGNPVHPPNQPFMNTVILFIFSVMLMGLIYLNIRRLRRIIAGSTFKRYSITLGFDFLLFGLALSCLFGLPHVLGVPLSSIRLFQPDVGILLTSIAARSLTAIGLHTIAFAAHAIRKQRDAHSRTNTTRFSGMVQIWEGLS